MGRIEVIGSDAGAPASLSSPAQALLRVAQLLVAPQRLLPQLEPWWLAEQAAGRIPLTTPCPELLASDRPEQILSPLEAALETDRPVVVLASGDPLWFGIGRLLLQHLGPERLRFHPAPSSLQLAFARIGRPWQDASWISLHGRDPEPLAAALQKRPAALAVLTDPGRGGAEEVRRILRASGLEASYALWLCERLGHPAERVQRLAPGEPLPADCDPLHLVLLIAEPPAPPRDPAALPLFGLDDGLFLQHDDRPGLMTKREVRIQLLADLALPDPDRVLIGGGGRERAAVLAAVLERLRPAGVVVIPLATVEALAELRPLLEQAGLTVSVSQHQAWRGAPLAEGTRLAPLNPVLVLRGVRQLAPAAP